MSAPMLFELSAQVNAIFDRAYAANSDLFGGSLLDLVADNIPRVSLADLKTAIIASGVYSRANDRIRRQIASYNR